MSTATLDRSLHVVPGTPAPSRARFAVLLALRDAARRLVDRALTVPRAGAGWVARHVRTLLDGLADVGPLAWVAARARDGIALARGVGFLPAATAVLTTPPIARLITAGAARLGALLARAGHGLWQQTTRLLGRAGTTGTRIRTALESAGTTVHRVLTNVTTHPAAGELARAVKAAAAVARPVSQSVVGHRLLRLLVPTGWLRALAELLLLPLLVDPGLRRRIPGRPGSRPTVVRSNVVPPPTVSRPPAAPSAPLFTGSSEPAVEDLAPQEDAGSGWGDLDVEPVNRAERRAQQRHQAQAKHTRPHR